MRDFERALGPLIDKIATFERPTYDDPRLAAYVATVGDRVSSGNGVPRRLRYLVTNDMEVNAWSSPGGTVFVSRSLLAALEGEADLAAILAHEISHSLLGHGLQSFFVTLLSAAQDRDAAELWEGDQERQADTVGIGLLRSAGYQSKAMPRALLRMARTRDAVGAFYDRQELLLRVARAALLRSEGEGESAADERYLSRIDGVVWGEDLRAGYLQGGSFVCPQCDLSFRLPQGWKGELNKGRLNATSSAKTPGKLSFLSVAMDSEMREAVVAKIQKGPFLQRTLAGMSAYQQDGPDALSWTIVGDNRVHMLTFEGAARDTAEQLVASISRPSPNAKHPESAHLRIRRVERTMTFGKAIESVCRQPKEQVAVLEALNGVDSSAEVPAGTRLRCIE